MDPSERQRLSISGIPKPFPRRVIRAPVPWATSFREAHIWQSQHLFTVSQIMVLLQDIWLNRYYRCVKYCLFSQLADTVFYCTLHMDIVYSSTEHAGFYTLPDIKV